MAEARRDADLREVAAGVQWYLDNFDASDEQLLDALMERISGPDFPTRGLIVGRRGIREAYRTGRGSITMRAVVEVEEDSRGRTCLVVKQLPFQVNPDNLATKIAELIKDGVPANAITTHGFGDDPAHLLVPTGPGVREPQNRRVEIIIALVHGHRETERHSG